jgi:Phage tail sheath C-terminal domain
MPAFPQQNSLYSPDQLYRQSDAEPFRARSLIVATDEQWKYVSVRRLALTIEQSNAASLQSAAFEPNGPVLWGSVQAAVSDFLNQEWEDGRLFGAARDQAYFVKCGPETTQSDVDNGALNVVVGFAPLEPAEFVIIAIAALAGPPAPDIGELPRAPPGVGAVGSPDGISLHCNFREFQSHPDREPCSNRK